MVERAFWLPSVHYDLNFMHCLYVSEQKRYSLQAGPPKKDPKSKGVNPAAIQALLKKQHNDTKKKGNKMKLSYIFNLIVICTP